MRGKHHKTLAAIFSEPTPGNLRWRDIESLLVALGAEVAEGACSRVNVALNGVRATFHRPHPQPDAKKSLVRAVRQLLENAGVTP